MEIQLDEYLDLPFQVSLLSGEQVDADSLPTFRIYAEGEDDPIETGEAAKRDDANTTGFYVVRTELTAGKGYAVETIYQVRLQAIVGGITGAKMLGLFQIVPADVLREGDEVALDPAYDAAKTAATQSSVTAIGTILSGITSLAAWLRGLCRKSAMDATAKAEINTGGGAYDETSDSNEAIANKTALITAGGITIRSPVVGKRYIEICRGRAHPASEELALVFEDEEMTWGDYTGAAVTLLILDRRTNEEITAIAGTYRAGPPSTLTFEPTAGETAYLATGYCVYGFQVVVTPPGADPILRAWGNVTVVSYW